MTLHRALKALSPSIGAWDVKTDDLIHLLAEDATPHWPFRRVMMFAAACSVTLVAVLFWAGIGFRSDIANAIGSPRFLFKFVVTIVLAITATRAVTALASPGVPQFGKMLWLALVPALILAGAGAELFTLPEPLWVTRMIGHNGRICLTVIPLLSIGPLAFFLLALKRGAPSNPGLAGAVAGLAASGIAATFYAANCDDDSPLFVMFWYTIATLMVTAVAYVIGRKLLRW